MNAFHKKILGIEKDGDQRKLFRIYDLSLDVCVVQWNALNGKTIDTDLYYQLQTVETRRGDLAVTLHDDEGIGILYSLHRTLGLSNPDLNLGACLAYAKEHFTAHTFSLATVCPEKRTTVGIPMSRSEVAWYGKPDLVSTN